jgi:flagellin-like protein
MNNLYRKLRKNSKALSPVVASIILIAVTVAVSVVVAAWMGGMSLGLMGNAEQATITNIAFDTTNDAITATVTNTGPGTITFVNVYLNGVSPASTEYAVSPSPTPAGVVLQLNKGETGTITFAAVGLQSGDYTVKLTSQKGNNFVLTQAYNP